METTHFYSRLRRDFGRKCEFTDTAPECLEAVGDWVERAHPFNRLDAYPLLVLSKEVIRRLLRHELESKTETEEKRSLAEVLETRTSRPSGAAR